MERLSSFINKSFKFVIIYASIHFGLVASIKTLEYLGYFQPGGWYEMVLIVSLAVLFLSMAGIIGWAAGQVKNLRESQVDSPELQEALTKIIDQNKEKEKLIEENKTLTQDVSQLEKQKENLHQMLVNIGFTNKWLNSNSDLWTIRALFFLKSFIRANSNEMNYENVLKSNSKNYENYLMELPGEKGSPTQKEQHNYLQSQMGNMLGLDKHSD